jgi:hypothetical protein
MKGGPSLVGSLGLSYQYKRFQFCLGCYSRPSTKYVFPHQQYSIPLFPKLGRQPYWVACLLVCVSGNDLHLILSWCRKKCNPSWFTDLMMKNKVAVLNQGTNSKIFALLIFKAGLWCSSVVIARLLSATEVLGSFLGWAVDK